MEDQKLEETLQTENQEVQNEETTQVEDTHQPEKEEVKAKSQEDAKEQNWRKMREEKERAERERDEMLRYFQQLQQSQQAQQPQHEEEPEPNYQDDDYVEWGQVKKHFKKMEDRIKKYEQKTTESTVEARLKAQYPDFDTVVSTSNVDALKRDYPEIAQTLSSSPDLYSKAVSAYKIIKKMGIYQDYDNSVEQQQVKQNRQRPRSSASVSPSASNSPLDNAAAFANGLTPELRQKLWAEMRMLRKKS